MNGRDLESFGLILGISGFSLGVGSILLSQLVMTYDPAEGFLTFGILLVGSIFILHNLARIPGWLRRSSGKEANDES